MDKKEILDGNENQYNEIYTRKHSNCKTAEGIYYSTYYNKVSNIDISNIVQKIFNILQKNNIAKAFTALGFQKFILNKSDSTTILLEENIEEVRKNLRKKVIEIFFDDKNPIIKKIPKKVIEELFEIEKKEDEKEDKENLKNKIQEKIQDFVNNSNLIDVYKDISLIEFEIFITHPKTSDNLKKEALKIDNIKIDKSDIIHSYTEIENIIEEVNNGTIKLFTFPYIVKRINLDDTKLLEIMSKNSNKNEILMILFDNLKKKENIESFDINKYLLTAINNIDLFTNNKEYIINKININFKKIINKIPEESIELINNKKLLNSENQTLLTIKNIDYIVGRGNIFGILEILDSKNKIKVIKSFAHRASKNKKILAPFKNAFKENLNKEEQKKLCNLKYIKELGVCKKCKC